jgi:hypothetical protein
MIVSCNRIWESENWGLLLNGSLSFIIQVIVDTVITSSICWSHGHWVICGVLLLRIVPVDRHHHIEGTSSWLGNLSLIDMILITLSASINTGGLLSFWILVDSNHLCVHKDGKRIIWNSCEVTTNNQRSLGKSPESEMRLLLGGCENFVSNLEHVWVVPMTWSCGTSWNLVD